MKFTKVDELECEALDCLEDTGMPTDEESILRTMCSVMYIQDYHFHGQGVGAVEELAARCEAKRLNKLAVFFRSRVKGNSKPAISFRPL